VIPAQPRSAIHPGEGSAFARGAELYVFGTLILLAQPELGGLDPLGWAIVVVDEGADEEEVALFDLGEPLNPRPRLLLAPALRMRVPVSSRSSERQAD